MCYNIQKMKQAFLARFNSKPLKIRISCLLCWSLGLILAALLLSGFFALAFAFASLAALAYLSIMLACCKIEETTSRCMEDNCSYTASRTVDIMLERFKEIAESDASKQIVKENDICREAIKDSNLRVCEIQETLDDIYLHVARTDRALTDNVLPELGICIEETEDAWIPCDVLDREIPYGLISLRISNRLNDEGIKTFADLVRCSDNDILHIPDFGPSALERIKQLLSLMNLHLKMTIKQEDGIWYYRREVSDSQRPLFEESLTAEDELLKEMADKEDCL